MYFGKSISQSAKLIHQTTNLEWTFSKRLVFITLMAALSSLFQSAGGFLPVAGYFISPLATAPVIFCFIVSFRLGWFAYGLTLMLLLLIQPSELIVFPFTTGLLGAGLGMAFIWADRRINVLLFGGISLFIGISFLLYVIGFPVLGPGVTTSFNWPITGIIFCFSLMYSLLWTELSRVLIKRISNILLP